LQGELLVEAPFTQTVGKTTGTGALVKETTRPVYPQGRADQDLENHLYDPADCAGAGAGFPSARVMGSGAFVGQIVLVSKLFLSYVNCEFPEYETKETRGSR